MTAKYFVWGEGVWRELDVASGRVTGWRRRARFVFVRRGKLLLARRRPVLRALQALAAGQPGAAADGPRLSHLSKSVQACKHRHKSPSAAPQPAPAAVPPACVHHHCCAHTRCVDKDKQTATALTPAPVAPQAAPALAPAPAAPTIPTPAAGSLARRSMATQCGTGGFTINVSHKQHTPPAPPAPASTAPSEDYSSSDEFLISRSLGARTGLDVLLNKHTPVTKLTTATSKKHKSDKDKPGPDRVHGAKKRARAVSSEQTSSGEERAVCKELLVSEDDIAAMRAFVRARCPSAAERFDNDDNYKRMLFYSINPLVDVERCARLESMLTRREQAALPHFAARLGLTPRSSQADPAPAPARARLRRGPARCLREPSTSSDTDKENKEQHASPNKVRSEVVDDVKKSPQLRPAPVTSEPALARVGGQGVSERGNKQKQVVLIPAPLTNGDVSDSPKAKKRASPASPPPVSSTKAAPASDVTAAASSTLHSVKAPADTHVISKRASQANAKEYSNLEDHAIVAWVSSGARASLVSGNRVWRDLEEQYERLTGRTRSWHSLRNRYLRYILPALGALHLPPATVSRLRAAAATGVIKTNQRPAPGDKRRHSMFKEPERGASSRLPGSAISPDGETPEPPATVNTQPDDDAAGPSSPKRRSLRSDVADKDSRSNDSRSVGGSQQAANNKQGGNQQSASKAGGIQQAANNKQGGNQQSPSKEGGSQQAANNKQGGNQQSPSKAGGGQRSASKASSSQRSASKAGGRTEAANNKKAGGKEARRSPRYSDVTRKFAARHRPPAFSSSSSSRSSRSPSPEVLPARSRRLFNPNAV